jgi:hypothetical protein
MILSHTPMLTLEDVRKNAENLNPIDDKGIIAIVQNWGNELIKQLQNNLLKNKTNASSGLSQSIDPKITQPPGGYNLSIMMEDYWFYVENGRKAGKMPPIQNIFEWIKNKRTIQVESISKSADRIAATRSLAYVIAKKIGKEGTKKQPFAVPALQQVTTEILAKRISTYIVDSLTK